MAPDNQAAELRLHDDGRDGRHTLTLVGELDGASAGVLEATIARLCANGASEVVLDLHELSYIDSAGLRVMLTGRQLCESHACDFSLTRVQVPVQRIFELTGLGERLSFRGRALTRRLPHGRDPAYAKSLDLRRPDFKLSFDLDPGAPRSVRDYMGDIVPTDASGTLREDVMLLTSELVARALRQRPPR